MITSASAVTRSTTRPSALGFTAMTSVAQDLQQEITDFDLEHFVRIVKQFPL